MQVVTSYKPMVAGKLLKAIGESREGPAPDGIALAKHQLLTSRLNLE